MPISKFTGGRISVRDKLNQLVDAVNALENIRGDGFIRVIKGRNGLTIGLELQQVISRVPRVGGMSTPTLAGTFARILSKTGTQPPYVYAAVQVQMVGWNEFEIPSDAISYNNVLNLEEQGSGGQWVNPLLVGDIVLIFTPNPEVDAHICLRSHYRGTY